MFDLRPPFGRVSQPPFGVCRCGIIFRGKSGHIWLCSSSVSGVLLESLFESCQFWAMAADELIKMLELVPYPGAVCKKVYFKEVYRSDSMVKPLSDDRSERNAFTTICLLVKQGEIGSWRRLKSDETFFYHKGNPMRIAVIKPNGKSETVLVGDKLKNDEARYHYTIVANSWLNYGIGVGDDDYGLFSAAVAPGFDPNDVETADHAILAEEYPQHAKTIMEFTNKGNTFY